MFDYKLLSALAAVERLVTEARQLHRLIFRSCIDGDYQAADQYLAKRQAALIRARLNATVAGPVRTM